MQLIRLPLLLLSLLLAACSDPPPERPVNEVLRPYLLRSGVDPAGENAVVVYLSLSDGSVREGPGRSAGTPWTAILLLVRVGTKLPAAALFRADDRTVDEGEGFVRIVSANGPLEEGVLRFTGPCGHQVLATQRFGDTPERGIYMAEMLMDGVYLQYQYGAESHDDHRRYADWAYGWYMQDQGRCPQSS